MKKILCALVVALFITGCIRTEHNMVITADGRFTLELISAIDISAFEDEDMDPEDMVMDTDDFDSAFTVEPYEKDGWHGIRATQELMLDDVAGDDPVEVDLSEIAELDLEEVQLFQSLGNNRYRANFVFYGDEDGGENELGIDMGDLEAMMDTTFSITLPFGAISHNADRTEGNTLTWDLSLVGRTDVKFEFAMEQGATPDTENADEEDTEKNSNMMLYIILAAVALGVVVAVVVTQKKKNNSNNMNMNM